MNNTLSEKEKTDKLYENAYLHGAGFCGWCGEGLSIAKKDKKIFGYCKYRGVRHE